MRARGVLNGLRGILAVIVGAMSAAALAGTWQLSYSGGQATLWGGSQQPYALSSGTYGGGGIAASGTITATFTWDYAGGSDDPPDTVYVLESCTAGGLSDNYHAAPTGDNGLGSGSVTSTTSPSPGYIQTSVNSTGIRVTNHYIGGATTFSVTASPSASGFQGSSVHYSAAVVQKAVTIDARNDESFHKGPDGPDSNLTSTLTPRYGDVGIDPNSAIYNFGEWHFPVNLTFSAELFGFWDRPVHSWVVDGQTYSDDAFTTYTSVPGSWLLDGPTVLGLGAGGPLDKVVTLNVTEALQQGVSASAVFHMRIHNTYDDWQNVRDMGSIYEGVSDFQVASPGYAVAGGGIQCTWSDAGPEWSDMQAIVGALAPVTSALIEDPLYAAGFAAAAIGVADLGPKPLNGVAPRAWNWPGSTIDSGDRRSSLSGFRMPPS